MNSLRRVLAATDFSQSARDAVDRAAIVCRDTGAHLHLMHAANVTEMGSLLDLIHSVRPDFQQDVVADANRELRKMAVDLSDRYGIHIRAHVEPGPAYPSIAACAEALAADLLVVGAGESNVLRRQMLGSTALHLAEACQRPVLVVKKAPRADYRTVLVPVDFSPHSLPALITARSVAPDAGIIVMHAYTLAYEGKLRAAGVKNDLIETYLATVRQDSFEQMHHLCITAGLPESATTLLATHGGTVEKILALEQEHNVDLVVMGRRGLSSGFEYLLVGGVTRHVLGQSTVDVLISTAEEKPVVSP